MATKTSGEFEQEFMQTAKQKTGKSLAEWLPVVKSSGLSKQMEITNWLKEQHQLNHLQASLLAGLYLNDGKPVYQNEANLLDNQFAKAADMRPLYEALAQWLTAQFADTQVIPKKTYISFTAAREFAAVNIKPKEIRLGMDLGDMPFTEALLPSKLSGPMPRISHMVVLTATGQLDAALASFLQASYNRTHKK